MHMSTTIFVQEKSKAQVFHDLTLDCAILSSVCTTVFSEDRNDPITGWQLLQIFLKQLKQAQYLVHHCLALRSKAWCELHCEILTSVRCCLGYLALVQERVTYMHMSTTIFVQEKSEAQVFHDLTLDCAILSSVSTTVFSEDRNDPITGCQLLQLFLKQLKQAQYLVHHCLTLRSKAWCELHCEIFTSVRCCLGCLALVQKRFTYVQIADFIVQILLETISTSHAAHPLAVLHTCMHLLGTLGIVLSYEELREIPSMMQLGTARAALMYAATSSDMGYCDF
ncbi:hypothetical protein PsorP6_006261 [Peronosclerospora sorghi]|uniref:Uncharacterized protein n=1 Tax=Peronosclerospora sorghi TaxID=230839 RepID=A0ACC0W237_9STRA|nr:hypothetical protein PsorP6_006261 [Peronosclerospora sorghi]